MIHAPINGNFSQEAGTGRGAGQVRHPVERGVAAARHHSPTWMRRRCISISPKQHCLRVSHVLNSFLLDCSRYVTVADRPICPATPLRPMRDITSVFSCETFRIHLTAAIDLSLSHQTHRLPARLALQKPRHSLPRAGIRGTYLSHT